MHNFHVRMGPKWNKSKGSYLMIQKCKNKVESFVSILYLVLYFCSVLYLDGRRYFQTQMQLLKIWVSVRTPVGLSDTVQGLRAAPGTETFSITLAFLRRKAHRQSVLGRRLVLRLVPRLLPAVIVQPYSVCCFNKCAPILVIYYVLAMPGWLSISSFRYLPEK